MEFDPSSVVLQHFAPTGNLADVPLDVFRVRGAVFGDEFGIPPDIDIDEHEADAHHFLLYDEQQKPIGCARFQVIDGAAKIERVAVLRGKYRNHGLATRMLNEMLDVIKTEGIVGGVYLYARKEEDVMRLYRRVGFVAASESEEQHRFFEEVKMVMCY